MLLLGNVGQQLAIGDLTRDGTADGKFSGPVAPA